MGSTIIDKACFSRRSFRTLQSSPTKLRKLKSVTFTESDDDRDERISEVNKSRRILPGTIINVLSLINIWDKCVESVQCVQHSEFYLIDAEHFAVIFEAHSRILKSMQDECTQTLFYMHQDGLSDDDNGPKYPLYAFDNPVVTKRLRAYARWRKKKAATQSRTESSPERARSRRDLSPVRMGSLQPEQPIQPPQPAITPPPPLI